MDASRIGQLPQRAAERIGKMGADLASIRRFHKVSLSIRVRAVNDRGHEHKNFT